MITPTCKRYHYVLKTDVDLNNCDEMSYFNNGKFSSESSDKLNIVSLVCNTRNGIKIQWTILLNHILQTQYVWNFFEVTGIFFNFFFKSFDKIRVGCIDFQLSWSTIDFQYCISSSLCFSVLILMTCRLVTRLLKCEKSLSDCM